MAEKENRIFNILQYLNKGNVRKNSNLTEEILKNQFDYTSNDFNEAFKEIESRQYIYRRDGTDHIAISEDGQTKYNELFITFSNESSKNLLNSAKIFQNVSIVISIVTVLILVVECIFIYTQNELIKAQNEVMKEQNEIMRQQNQPSVRPAESDNSKTGTMPKFPAEKKDSIIK